MRLFYALLFSFGLATSAYAQQECKPKFNLAKPLFESAEAFFKEEKYPEAITNYQEALKYSCNQSLLYNIAQSYYFKAKKEQNERAKTEGYQKALEYYKRFLQESPADKYPEARANAELVSTELSALLAPKPDPKEVIPATIPGKPADPPKEKSSLLTATLAGTSVGLASWGVAAALAVKTKRGTQNMTPALKRTGQITSLGGDLLVAGFGAASALLFIKSKKTEKVSVSISPTSVAAQFSF